MLVNIFKTFFGRKTSEISLRLLTKNDFLLLSNWLGTPHVLRWWKDPYDIESVTAKYTPCLDENSLNPVRVYIIESDNQSVGMIQCYRHCDHPHWDRIIGIKHAAGIDYFIGVPNQLGKGIGSKAIEQITKLVFDLYPEIDVVVAVTQKNNKRSWRALEKAGFSRLEERLLESDHPSDKGISYIYGIQRPEKIN